MSTKKPAPKARKTTKAAKSIAVETASLPEKPEVPIVPTAQGVAIPAKQVDIVCKKCGGVNPASASLCRKCGSKLLAMPPPAVVPEQPEAPRVIPAHGVVASVGQGNIVCKRCGGVNPDSANICRRCGSNLVVTQPMVVSAQSVSSRCSKCGHQNQPVANFCARCGARIEAVSRSKFCPRCGDPVAVDEKFCDKCGKKLA